MWGTLFIYWLGIIPLWVFNFRFEEPKVNLLLVAGLCLAIYWIRKLLGKSKNMQFKGNDIWFLVWLGVLTVAGVVGIHPIESILGGSYRHQGILFFLSLFLIAKTVEILTKELKKKLIKIMAFVLVFEFLLIVVQYFFGQVYFGKPLGTIGEANAVTGFLAIGSVFVLEALPRWVIFTLPLSILVEGSRSGALAFFVFFLSAFLKNAKRLILIVVTIVLVLYVGFISWNKTYTMFEDRSVYWGLALRAVVDRPLLGYGAESGEEVYKSLYGKSGFPLSELIVDRSHNLFLDIAMWSGLIGLVPFVGWLMGEYKSMESTARKAAFLTFLTYSFLQPLSVVHWLIFILILRL